MCADTWQEFKRKHAVFLNIDFNTHIINNFSIWNKVCKNSIGIIQKEEKKKPRVTYTISDIWTNSRNHILNMGKKWYGPNRSRRY